MLKCAVMSEYAGDLIPLVKGIFFKHVTAESATYMTFFQLFWPEYTIRLFGSLAEIFCIWLHYREGPLLFSSLLDLLDHQILFYLYESNVVWKTVAILFSYWALEESETVGDLTVDFDVCPFIGAAIKSKKWGDLHLHSARLVESITIATAQHGPQWLAGENLVYLKCQSCRKRVNWFAGV